ncbi:MAG: 16S rRNA (cytidine(1402)-2'-O)-methyltransferase [Steroidobacteraceae bacterium]
MRSLTSSSEPDSLVRAAGRLDVVATPIGNLGDVSARARRSLEEAHLIAAEDTRRTLGMLEALGISRPLISLHAHNESRRLPDLIRRLEQGAIIALVSDAGTPLVCDPGAELVRRAIEAGIEVRPIPGASAVLAAITVAGLPAERFCFEGFLPAAARARRERLEALAAEPRTLVFFEAPHRIVESLVDFATVLGAERRAAVARELTKAHETIYRGTLAQLAERARQEASFERGEITLVVAGAAPEARAARTPELRRTVELLARELPPGKAAALAAQLTGARRSEAYAIALELTKS